MASTSASLVQKSFKYDVFLSFRGEDTRKNFVDHLYHALHHKGIITYKDDERIEKGERISDQLVRSIEESRFYIIVFSKNYASSSWCLDELVKIMECQKTKEQTAYPVFYDVEPTEVRNQSGPVGEAFAKHVEKEALEIWIDALKKAADLAGWELKNTLDGHEAEFIQQIVQEIFLKLHVVNSSIDEKLVGMKTRVKSIVSSLETASEVVRMIGIKGIGGGGKTTLARAVFDLISVWFEGKSFVENVREVSKGSLSGLKKLQKKLLSDVLNDPSILEKNISDLEHMMKKMMCNQKILVVLDDVDAIEQLEALAGELTWFKPGSRIIITTRDKQVLVAHRVNFIHDVNLLLNDEAVCLFSRHAFGREFPIHGYEDLSGKVVRYAAGLPLTIKVLGSHLCGRSEPEWVDCIERLKTIPLEKTLKRLELSYNGLENDEKEIFLDVVCILKGENMSNAIRMLESCGFHARIGLSVLEQKSLITIFKYGGFQFHDHIEEMAWSIVRHTHLDEPSRHSRLWIKEEIEAVLVNESGTKETKCIKLKNTYLHVATIMKGLRKMKELRYLYVKGGFRESKVDEVSQYFPDALRVLCWYEYPLQSLPKTFKANKLVNLEMPRSNISQLWEVGESKVLDKLKFLNLCSSNVRYLNLGMTPHLEELHLEGCRYLQEIHAPVGCLKKLVYLNLRGCLRFEDFVIDKREVLPSLHSLIKMKFKGESLDACPLHPNSNLPKIRFKCEYDESVSLWSGNLEKLLSFGLCTCTNLESLSESICGLQHLQTLTLEGSIPEALFKDLHKMESLDELNVLEIKHLPTSICMLKYLKNLKLSFCWSLGQLPLHQLESLVTLTLEGGIPEALLKDLHQLESLEKLCLSWMGEIKNLPDSICMLKHLKTLKIEFCWLLEQLPKEICRLECLEELHLFGCDSLQEIPNSICTMNCLKYLCLHDCVLVKKLPEELGLLESLEVLDIDGAGISHLPQSIYDFKGLKIIGSREQLESYGFTSMTNTTGGLTGYTARYHVIT